MKNVLLLLVLISGVCQAQTYDEYCRNGSMQCAKGNYKEAIQNFKIAISMDSMNGYAYQGRALTEDEMGNHIAAINDYTWYMALSKDSAMGCIWRAEIEKNIRKYRQALADCNASLRLRPGFMHALCMRADIKFALKDYKGAIADYDTILMRDSIALYQYFFHRAAAKYMILDYAGGTFDKQNGEYFANYSPLARTVAPHPVVPEARPIAARYPALAVDTRPLTMKPRSVKSEGQRVRAEPQRFAAGEPFRNKWVEGFKRDSIFTELKLSRAIATEPDKAPLYAARGLIAERQGRTGDACIDFMKAKEMGYTEADEMLNVFCK